jgi:hypothetical protein
MGVTLLHDALPINIVGCALSAPDGSSPRGYSRKKSFSSIGSNIIPSIILQLEILSISLIIVAPKAIIENPSYIILFINFVPIGAILLLSYIIFFYDVNEHVTLYECEPFDGQHCNSRDF